MNAVKSSIKGGLRIVDGSVAEDLIRFQRVPVPGAKARVCGGVQCRAEARTYLRNNDNSHGHGNSHGMKTRTYVELSCGMTNFNMLRNDR